MSGKFACGVGKWVYIRTETDTHVCMYMHTSTEREEQDDVRELGVGVALEVVARHDGVPAVERLGCVR